MAKPPSPGQGGGGGYPPPQEESSSSTGLIIGIVAAILFVVVGLPVLACGGCFFYARHQANQVFEELEQEAEQIRLQEQQQEQARNQALLVILEERLYKQAKVDIETNWTLPDKVRTKRWADWKVRKVETSNMTENRYEISGILQLGIRDAGTQTYKWACEYSTLDDPKSASADWKLERVTIDGEQQFPK